MAVQSMVNENALADQTEIDKTVVEQLPKLPSQQILWSSTKSISINKSLKLFLQLFHLYFQSKCFSEALRADVLWHRSQ